MNDQPTTVFGMPSWSRIWECVSSSAASFSIIFVLFVGVLYFLNWASTAPANYALLSDHIPDAKKMGLEMIASRSELMSSWAIAVMASLGFIFNYVRGKKHLSKLTVIIGFSVFLLAFVSVFLSHIQFDVMARMLILGEDPVDNERVFTLLRGQFFALVGAIVVFVTFVFFVAFGEDVQKGEKGVSRRT